MNPVFRWAYILDIAVLAFIAFGVLTWLVDRPNRRIALGLTGLVLLHAIAEALGLVMVATLLSSMLPLLLISIVIVFQDDLRRACFRVVRFDRRRTVGDDDPALQDLPKVCAELVRREQGALVVIVGNDDLDDLLEGGVSLRAPVESSILLSLFDPHSPGHDGAVVIRDGEIVRFGAHLPLAEGPLSAETVGTRHRAAVGLATVSDAHVIVVSEERGTIRIAREGQLGPPLEGPGLEEILRGHRARSDSDHRGLPWSRIGRIFLAIGMSVMAWWLLSPRLETLQRTFEAPIEYRNIPPGFEIRDGGIGTVRLTLSGTEHAFGYLSAGQIRVSVDATGLTTGDHDVVVGPQHLKIPNGLTIYRLEPRFLRVRLLEK